MTIRRALFFSYFDKYGSFAIGLIGSMIIARLLSPTEIGTFSVAAVIVGMAGTIRDFGAGTFVVQMRELHPQQIRSTFGLALSVGALISLVLAASAGPIARFYANPGVGDVVLILALNFLVVPLGSISQALLARDMRFGDLAKVNLTSSVTNAVVGVAMSWWGFGFVSLAWAIVASSLVSAAMSFRYRPKKLPWTPSVHGWKEVFGFGGYATGFSLINEGVQGTPELALGKLSTFSDVGLFSRANSLAQSFQQVFLRGMWPILLPYFSKAHRDGISLRIPYLEITTVTTGIGWAFFAVLAVMANDVILVLYGAQWIEAAPVLRLISIGSAVWLCFALSTHALIAVGGLAELFRIHFICLWVRCAIIIACAMLGPNAVAVATGAGFLFLGFSVQPLLRKYIGIDWIDYLRIIRMNALLVVASIPGPLLVKYGWWFAGVDPWERLFFAGGGATVGFALALRFGTHPLRAWVANLYGDIGRNRRERSDK